MCLFCETTSSQSYRICVKATSAPVNHLAYPRWRTSVYLITLCCSQPRGVAGFATEFARRSIVHVRISLGVDRKLQVVFICLKESMSSAQCSMRLKKVAECLAL